MTTTYEVVHDYTAYGECARFFRCRDPECLIAGPADTGKTMAALFKLHRCALKYPGASIVITRKQLTDTFSTVLQTFVKKVIQQEIEAGIVRVYGGEKPQWFDYRNGSRIWIAGLDKSSKVLSAEHDLIYVNQAEELGLPDWEILTSRTTGRAGNMPYNQVIADCNPAGPAHWIMTRSDNGGPLTRFDSTHRDNPELYDPETGLLTEGGEQRLGRLRNLTGSRLLRLYHGLWAAPEGAIYDIFEGEYGKHKVHAFNVPALWPRVVGIDPVGAFTAAVWLAYDQESKILSAYREYFEPFGTTTPGHVRNILEATGGETVWAWIGGGPSERQARLDFAGGGIPLLEPPVKEVWAGIDRVYQLLKDFKLVIHDSCPQLLSELGSYQRKLKDGVPTESIEKKEEFHLCLAAGTMVETGRGSIPIENVLIDDWVLTRQGYRKVLLACCTDYDARCLTVRFSNGATLTATPDHPVYVKGNGHIALRDLRYADIMETSKLKEVSPWQEKKSNLMNGHGTGIPILGVGLAGFISRRELLASWSICIATSGKKRMDLFQKPVRYITEIMMQRIISWRTWNYFPAVQGIWLGMAIISLRNYYNEGGCRSRLLERQHRNGMVRQKGWLGTVSWERCLGKVESQLRSCANIAALNLKRWPCMAIRGFVQTIAKRLPVVSQASIMRREPANSVAAPSLSINTQKSVIVPVRVVSVMGNERRQPVYNLLVEGTNEFYANEILVKNCDALRYAIIWLTEPGIASRVTYDPVRIGRY